MSDTDTLERAATILRGREEARQAEVGGFTSSTPVNERVNRTILANPGDLLWALWASINHQGQAAVTLTEVHLTC